MAIRPILRFPDSLLSREAKTVEEFDAALRALADDLLDTMRAAPGIGITAPHIGILQRLTVSSRLKCSHYNRSRLSEASSCPRCFSLFRRLGEPSLPASDHPESCDLKAEQHSEMHTAGLRWAER